MNSLIVDKGQKILCETVKEDCSNDATVIGVD